MRPLNHGISAEIILDSEQAPKSFTWTINGSDSLLAPPVGRDAEGRWLELNVDQDGGRQTISWTGRVADGRRLRLKGALGWHENVAWPVRIDPTVNEAIGVTGDDGNDIGGNLYTGYIYLGAGQYNNGEVTTAGFRFQTVNVPQAATIDSAQFSVEVLTTSGTPDLRMYGNDVDDAGTWSAPGNLPSGITQTTAFSEVDNFTSAGVKTVDVTSIIQEIVDRGGWAANNDLALVLFNNQASNGHWAEVADLNHTTAQEGQLDIDYTVAGGGGATGKGLLESNLLSPRRLVH